MISILTMAFFATVPTPLDLAWHDALRTQSELAVVGVGLFFAPHDTAFTPALGGLYRIRKSWRWCYLSQDFQGQPGIDGPGMRAFEAGFFAVASVGARQGKAAIFLGLGPSLGFFDSAITINLGPVLVVSIQEPVTYILTFGLILTSAALKF